MPHCAPAPAGRWRRRPSARPRAEASNDRFADVSPDQFSIGRAYRRRSASTITPAATRTKTMTTASASTEARVSYQLFQSSRMRPRSNARLALRKFPLSKGRSSATKNAMLRLVARVLIARQHGLCRADVEAITIRTPVFAKVDCRRAARWPERTLSS